LRHATRVFILLRTAHGDYEQAQFGVLDQDDSPLDVRVDWIPEA
jgi:hypothetical protein